MNFSKIINYILILVGGIVALYVQAEDTQNVYILIGGIVLLMIGLYRTSRNIPSKNTDDDKDEDL